jgi:hypothetical protein
MAGYIPREEPRPCRARPIGMGTARYGRRMRTTSRGRAAALLAAAVITCAGCGTTTAPHGSDNSPSTPTRAGPDQPGSSPAPVIVVLRTGGIAGVHDMVAIAADGTAHLTSKTRTSRNCTPSAAAVARLRALDLSAMPAPTMRPGMADMFSYSVQVGAKRAVASEGGGATGRPADLVDAAAAVLASCLAS